MFVIFDIFFLFLYSLARHNACLRSTTIRLEQYLFFALCTVYSVQPTGRCENQKIFIFILCTQGIVSYSISISRNNTTPLRKWTPNAKHFFICVRWMCNMSKLLSFFHSIWVSLWFGRLKPFLHRQASNCSK